VISPPRGCEALFVVIATAAAWAILIALVNPRREFPMMNDWISSSSRTAAPILAATR
jgi:hypothetical protein